MMIIGWSIGSALVMIPRRESGKKVFFRHYPKKDLHFKQTYKTIPIKKLSDNRHKKAQQILIDILNKHIGQSLVWYYKDERLSDFPISGDLLKYVEVIEAEYKIEIKPLNLDSPYIIDIVLLGPKIKNERVIMGAIEIENTHEAEFLKVLVCKSLGFPLLTIDISEYTENEIDENLCRELLLETTNKNISARRRNYIYLHNLLLPIFIQKDNYFHFDDGHQYIIFMRNEKDIDSLKNFIRILKDTLNLNESNVLFAQQRINKDAVFSITMRENDIKLLSDNLSEYTIDRYIRLIMDRPEKGKNIFIFHLILCKLLALRFDCIVAYKHMRRYASNFNEEESIWAETKYNKNTSEVDKKRYCPKQLSEPIFKIMDEINRHSK